jgi:hypothetical protein
MPYSTEEREMWITDWRASGKSAWAYARANGLNPQTFKNWTQPKLENQMGFVEVPVTIPKLHHSTEKILIEQGDMRIHLPVNIGSMELRTIFGALRGWV